MFALTTQTMSADLKTKIVPCQFGGNPDCGSVDASRPWALAAVAAHKFGRHHSGWSAFSKLPSRLDRFGLSEPRQRRR